MLGARMWRIAIYHKEDTALDWYSDIKGILLLTFGFELPKLEEPPVAISLSHQQMLLDHEDNSSRPTGDTGRAPYSSRVITQCQWQSPSSLTL